MDGGRTMTEQIGNHGLFCLDDDDYAAIALAMQCNAQAADAALSAQGSAMSSYLGRPYGQTINTVPITVFDDNSGGAVGPFGIVGSSSGEGSPTAITNGWTSPSVFSIANPPAGFWLMGSSVNWTLVTPTAGTYRQLSVFGTARINGEANIATTFTDWYNIRDYQGDGGNSGSLNVWGFLENTNPNEPISSISAFFSHGNTGGTLTIPVGGWRVWAMYLGSGLVI